MQRSVISTLHIDTCIAHPHHMPLKLQYTCTCTLYILYIHVHSHSRFWRGNQECLAREDGECTSFTSLLFYMYTRTIYVHLFLLWVYIQVTVWQGSSQRPQWTRPWTDPQVLNIYIFEMTALGELGVVLCCFFFLLCCVALPCLSKHLMDD